MAPLSVHFEGSDEPKLPLEKWCYAVGFASLIPALGLVFVLLSIILGIVKIERKGGWILLVLAFFGFCVTGGLAALFYDQISPYFTQSSTSTTPTVAAGSPVTTGPIVWLQPDEGLKESQKTHKPILYDFTAHWCGWCKRMDGAVFENPKDAAKINSLFIPVVVMDQRQELGKNPSDVAELQSRYGVRGFPTLVVQYPDNGRSWTLGGFGGESAVMDFLTQSRP